MFFYLKKKKRLKKRKKEKENNKSAHINHPLLTAHTPVSGCGSQSIALTAETICGNKGIPAREEQRPNPIKHEPGRRAASPSGPQHSAPSLSVPSLINRLRVGAATRPQVQVEPGFSIRLSPAALAAAMYISPSAFYMQRAARPRTHLYFIPWHYF